MYFNEKYRVQTLISRDTAKRNLLNRGKMYLGECGIKRNHSAVYVRTLTLNHKKCPPWFFSLRHVHRIQKSNKAGINSTYF